MDRRQEGRLAVELLGSLTSIGHRPVCVQVSQVSANGCRVSGEDLDLHPGDRVEIDFAGLGHMPADVQWAREDAAGVRFAASLHPAILQYLATFIRLAG